MRITWTMVEDGRADAFDGHEIELDGWWVTPDPQRAACFGLLLSQVPCCALPAAPGRAVELQLARPLVAAQGSGLRVRGRFTRLHDDPTGWRYRCSDAQVEALPEGPPGAPKASRRRLFLASGAALGLVACSAGRFTPYRDAAASVPVISAPSADAAGRSADIREWLGRRTTIDMHSHAGRVIVSRDPAIGAQRPFVPVAAPMRDGGMHVICLAIVTDTLATRVSADRQRFEAWREPQPGELHALSQTEFARAAMLIEREGLNVIANLADLDAARTRGPSVIIASEGADFLEGRLERVDEAHREHRLRHLQLTHFRVNELGDIQTEPPVHGGLTDFGAAVVRRCNALGIVVDLAHGTEEMVKRAASITTRPLVISHTSLVARPGARSRRIGAAHARAIADTGGVIGVWPSVSFFHDLPAMAQGARQLADVIGVEHVGLGTDMLGFITPPVLDSYRQLPAYGSALMNAGFTADQVTMVLGGNYERVFRAVLARPA